MEDEIAKDVGSGTGSKEEELGTDGKVGSESGGAGKSILKKPSSSSQSKKHIVDELDLGLTKKSKLNFAVTPPGKSSTQKNFIKKNIKRSNLPPALKSSPIPEDSLISDLLDKGQKKKK